MQYAYKVFEKATYDKKKYLDKGENMLTQQYVVLRFLVIRFIKLLSKSENMVKKRNHAKGINLLLCENNHVIGFDRNYP